MFYVRDESLHKTMKRPIANAFSMSSMIELEPAANACTEIFERKLLEKQGAPIDLGTWLHWYAFDLITSITFSNRLGFMEKETDVSDGESLISDKQLLAHASTNMYIKTPPSDILRLTLLTAVAASLGAILPPYRCAQSPITCAKALVATTRSSQRSTAWTEKASCRTR